MTKLYKKNEILFAILWIVAYVVLSSLADQMSESIGIIKSITLAVHIVLSAILYFWIRNSHLEEKYGLCQSRVPASRFLYYLPLAVIALVPFINGFTVPYRPLEIFCYAASMCLVGFLEEVIFRGLLFKAMAKDGIRHAVIVSAVTFGIGHIVNLINGSGQSTADTIVQIIFAVLVGFVLVLIFHYGGSLYPCIIFHSLNNALHVFAAEGTMDPKTEMILNLVLITAVLGAYLLYLYRTFVKEK